MNVREQNAERSVDIAERDRSHPAPLVLKCFGQTQSGTDVESNDDRMMTRPEAAEYLGLRPATLEAWASRGTVKLPVCKLGRAVRYRKRDLDQFIEANRTTVKRKPA